MSCSILKNGPNELGIEQATGRIAFLKRGDKVFIEKATGFGPVRFHYPYPDFEAHLVEACDTHPSVVEDERSIVVEYKDMQGKRGATCIDARVKFEAIEDGCFELTCEVTNRSKQDLPQVFFPYLSGFGMIDGIDDQITRGKESFKPWKEFVEIQPDRRIDFMSYLSRRTSGFSANSPVWSGIKWMDFSGATAGVSLFSREKEPTVQYVFVGADAYDKPAETIDLFWYFYPYIRPGETWKSPAFVIYPHDGDWHRGILKFKEHASRTFRTLPSTPERDASVGQFSFWMSWHYQDWQNVKHTFKDIPAIAEEARAAGLREMTLARGTVLDFCLPHVVREELGSVEGLRAAIDEARKRGVNITPFISCQLIRQESIGADRNPPEWYKENIAGQRGGDNWTYDPHMTPAMPILQIGSRAAWYICAGSKGWRDGFRDLVDQVSDEWGCHGLMFDQSSECGPINICFNPLHDHRPDQTTILFNRAMLEARKRLEDKFGNEAVISGEGQWDAATEWMDFTWTWTCFGDTEPAAPFFMAFPRVRACFKCTDHIPQINRVFTCGYWVDINLEDGAARLGDYPELTRYLASLAAFKQQFSPFFNRRDFYLHTIGTDCPSDDRIWIRSHRVGNEALVMVTDADGNDKDVEIELDIEQLIGSDNATLTVWSRKLEELESRDVGAKALLRVAIPPEDFVGIHVEGTRNDQT